jgi:hypothetical protein
MDSGMFYGIQKELLKQRLGLMLWMKSIKKATEELAEKLGCKVYKEGFF